MRTVIEAAEAVRRRDATARELVEETLSAIGRRNDELNAFVHVAPDLALAEAARVDAQVARGEDPGPLAGVPFGVKDMDRCAGMPTTFGSLLYKGLPPQAADSVHVARLRAAGAIPVGVTASPEFGLLQYTRSRAWGVTRNPWDPTRTPGGSSGGSAAAVAAGMVPMATAGDGGGSTRIPAAFSGLVGFKPSFGRIPREGATTSQTAVWGALTTTVADAARHLDVASGPDDRDRTSLPAAHVIYEDAIETLDVSGLRAVWSPDLGYAVVDPEVLAATEPAAEALVAAANLRHISTPLTFTEPTRAWFGAGAIDIWLHLQEPGLWPDRAADLTSTARRSFEATERITAPQYAEVLRLRSRMEQEVAALFRDADVLLTPTTAVPAFPAEGPDVPTIIAGRQVEPPMTVPFTMVANLCWNPAVSVPAGLTSAGLPVGLQIMARRHADDLVLRLARVFELARPWPRHAPGPGG